MKLLKFTYIRKFLTGYVIFTSDNKQTRSKMKIHRLTLFD